MADVVQRTALGTFLRARREATGPVSVGLRPGGRRRTPGLRREELAQLAGMSVTWYTWLEPYTGQDTHRLGRVKRASHRRI